MIFGTVDFLARNFVNHECDYVTTLPALLLYVCASEISGESQEGEHLFLSMNL